MPFFRYTVYLILSYLIFPKRNCKSRENQYLCHLIPVMNGFTVSTVDFSGEPRRRDTGEAFTYNQKTI
ncbi:MAG: hypothetical protein EZS26_003067 [Candidatus Ordinivivax streblomastigis]|uniref:Uncharacterized protein n=1 Tax=Candidatus Ordinivivax streblomastigis TaxID=2540710 RepID=A0A5M8NYI1_9BACT|nr:MAG: hypothetical protein EZS26_003067 [Candidatus Ordinivivax streblomastigis]